MPKFLCGTAEVHVLDDTRQGREVRTESRQALREPSGEILE
jgi:hypothetical protein